MSEQSDKGKALVAAGTGLCMLGVLLIFSDSREYAGHFFIAGFVVFLIGRLI